MCFSSPKIPDAPAPPPAAAVIPPPPPIVQPSEVSAQTAAEDRQKRIQQTRYGLASTIKTGAQGIVGAGAELQPQTQGKTTLG